MPMLRYAAAPIVEAGITVDRWADKVYQDACSGGRCRIKTAKTVLAKYDPKKYLLTHCSIIAAVDTDLANPSDPKSDYLIKPEYSKFINNNGDAWTKKMIEACYKTFIGANNYLEHVQIPELSKGKVIDAVLREIPLGIPKGKTGGEDLTTYYVDILVATERKHKDLVRKIEANELGTLSMGCVIAFSQCSKCGKRAVDESEACQHIRYEKGNTFYDSNGVLRKIAELCGHYSEPDSVKFVDASWVKQPAFTGAVMRNVIDPPADIMAKIEEAEKKEGYIRSDKDFLKAASHLIIAQDPPEEEAPPEEEESEIPGEEEAAPEEEEAPAEESPEAVPPEEAPPEEEDVSPEDEAKEWRKKLKNKMINELGEEIIEDLTEDEGARPTDLSTLDETIIKPASLVFHKVWGAKKSWDRFIRQRVGSLDSEKFNRLRYGTHILMTSDDPTVLKDYGYNKRDFLAVLSFLDDTLKDPLPIKMKKTIAKMGGSQGRGVVSLLEEIVSDLGRKVTKKEATKALAWLRLLDFYS